VSYMNMKTGLPTLLGKCRAALLVGALIGGVAMAQAQLSPTQDPADRLLRERQQEEREERLQQQAPEVGVQKEALVLGVDPGSVADLEPTFPIETVRLVGNGVLPDSSVNAIVKPFTGIRLGVNRINLLLRRLTQAFIDRGYITTRAYIGSQNLASGTLEVTVLLGKVERIELDGKPLGVGERLALPIEAGEILRLADLEQGIDQLNRLKRNQAELQILPGEQAGGSIISIKNQPGDRIYYSFGVDNYGDQATGETRYRSGVETNDLFGLQENLSLNYVGSLDTNAVVFGANVPWGYNTFSYTYSYSEFQNLIGDTALLFGEARGHTYAWNRQLARSRLGKSGLDVSLSLRHSAREINGIELSPQDLSVLRVAYNRLRRFQAGHVPGYWTADLGYTRGLDAFGAASDSDDLPNEAAHAQFDKVDSSLSLGMDLNERWRYHASLAGQWTRRALYSSEQIFAGGATTVRGFRSNALAGDRGLYTRHELSYAKIPTFWQDRIRIEPYAFLDAGRLQLVAEGKWANIASAGLGVRITSKRFSTEIVLAQPVSTPGSTTDDGIRVHVALTTNF
jgi:hemolysin activation/secretion protein